MHHGTCGASGRTQAQPHSGLPTVAGETPGWSFCSALGDPRSGEDSGSRVARRNGRAGWSGPESIRGGERERGAGGHGSEVLHHVLTSAGSGVRIY